MKEGLPPIPIYLKTLTPLHIGTGEELSPLDYMVYEGLYYPISQDNMLQLIKKLQLSKEFAGWIHDKFAEMAKIIDNRQLADARNALTPFEFFNTRAKDKLGVFLSSIRETQQGYKVNFDEQTERRYRGQKAAVLGQVRAAIKTGAHQAPYLPGTSLKGSLRTAMFYHHLSNKHSDPNLIAKAITDQLTKRVKKEQFALPLIYDAFYCGMRDKEGRYSPKDEKMDLFKLVSFSDAALDNRSAPLQLAKFNIYLVQKERGRPGSPLTLRAAMQSQASYCETIGSGQTLRSLLNFDIDFLLHLKKWIKNDSVGDQWIGIEAKVKRLFNIDLQTLTEENRRQKRDEIITHLLTCWHNFAQKQHQRQQTWLDKFLENDPARNFIGAKKGFEQIKTTSNQYLLHLGYATGFLGTTALIYFLEDNSSNQQLYQKALERFGLGNRPGNRGDYRLDMPRFPKSRRLIDENGKQVMPGWMALSLEPISNQSTATEESLGFVKSYVEPVSVPVKTIMAEFPTRPIKSGQQVTLDAVVIASARPNKVCVYVREGYLPEMVLQGYRSELPLGKVLLVRAILNKKGDVMQVDYVSEKKG